MITIDASSFPDQFIENVESVLRKEKAAAISTLSVGDDNGLQSYQLTFAPLEGGVLGVVEHHLRTGDALDTELLCDFVKARYKHIRPTLLLEVLERMCIYGCCEQYIAAAVNNVAMVTNGQYVLVYANEVDDPFSKVIVRASKTDNIKYN